MSQSAPDPIGGPPRSAGASPSDGAGTADVVDLQQQVRRTREELGDTVAALSARADVKARAREQAAEVADRTRERAAQVADRAREQAIEVADRARQVDLRQAGDRTVDFARRRPGPVLAVLSGAVLALVTVLRRRRRRDRAERRGRR